MPSEEILIDIPQESLLARLKDKCSACLTSIAKKWKSLNKKQKLLMAGSALTNLTLIIVITLWWLRPSGQTFTSSTSLIKSDNNNAEIDVTSPEELRDQQSPLDGILVTEQEIEEIKNRRPLGIIIDNHISARPSFGLNKADLVYEALVEGSITRFMAVYLREQPEKVGPVRSLRTYFLDWLAEFNEPIIMHIGFAPPAPLSAPEADVLAYIYRHGFNTLGIYHGTNFWRVSDRLAPHNALTSTTSLWEKAKQNKWTGLKDIKPWQFKTDEVLANRPSIQQLSLNWDGWGKTNYSASWTYDQKQNRYLREQANVKAIDADDSNNQIWAKNLIIEFTVQTRANDPLNHVIYQTTGNGRALIFLDGKTIEGVWKKDSRTARTRYYNTQGDEIEFNRGRCWIMIAPAGSEVIY
ncbi:DUF3048 domain-containing protein [Patescibacteria group bacterium]|nr:DUF3048 domain-containing protein [Patescibacteria group bacterium]MBU1867888.1 DUF3048 domain-containing protein [Patescibacteria group bacterium]